MSAEIHAGLRFAVFGIFALAHSINAGAKSLTGSNRILRAARVRRRSSFNIGLDGRNKVRRATHRAVLSSLPGLQSTVHAAPAFHLPVCRKSPIIGAHNENLSAICGARVLPIFFSSAYAAPTINIFFANNTPFDFTIKPSAANSCIEKYDGDSFTVPSREKRTYYATLEQNCVNASVTFDYSQTYYLNSAENLRRINGTLTYEQFQQNGKWMAKLYMSLTPPIPEPIPVLFRTTCDQKFLFCGTTPVALTSNNFFASLTIIPEGISWGFGALTR